MILSWCSLIICNMSLCSVSLSAIFQLSASIIFSICAVFLFLSAIVALRVAISCKSSGFGMKQ